MGLLLRAGDTSLASETDAAGDRSAATTQQCSVSALKPELTGNRAAGQMVNTRKEITILAADNLLLGTNVSMGSEILAGWRLVFTERFFA